MIQLKLQRVDQKFQRHQIGKVKELDQKGRNNQDQDMNQLRVPSEGWLHFFRGNSRPNATHMHCDGEGNSTLKLNEPIHQSL